MRPGKVGEFAVLAVTRSNGRSHSGRQPRRPSFGYVKSPPEARALISRPGVTSPCAHQVTVSKSVWDFKGECDWHKLRHSYVSALVRAGVPLPQVQKLAGARADRDDPEIHTREPGRSAASGGGTPLSLLVATCRQYTDSESRIQYEAHTSCGTPPKAEERMRGSPCGSSPAATRGRSWRAIAPS